jgi:hypothetical protein
MPGVAQEFVTRLSAEGLALDFTPASLAILDRVLATGKKQLAAMPLSERSTQESWACLNMGAYVGEVLRCEDGGVWTKGEDGLPRLDLGSHQAPVVAVVLGLINDGAVEMPGGDGRPVSLTAPCNWKSTMRGRFPSAKCRNVWSTALPTRFPPYFIAMRARFASN